MQNELKNLLKKMTSQPLSIAEEPYKFSIAPMMDYTDKHFRVLMRQVSKRALLYTEMIVAQALHYTKEKEPLLDFNDIEHPIALQIGGDDPILLAESARIAANWGYDEINLNVGCPSPRVKAGSFGACLMANPDHLASCIEAMANACDIPVTVKHRIGIDNLDSDLLLETFVDTLASAGAKRFSIHARKAWLSGLNPKENRTIPPLEYERVIKLKKKRPHLSIELNGGLNTPQDCIKALKIFDGAMVGRAAYSHPLLWQNIDALIFGEKKNNLKPSIIIKRLIPYTENHLKHNGRLWDISKHMIKLIEGIPGAKAIRREISEKTQTQKNNISILEKIAQQLEETGH